MITPKPDRLKPGTTLRVMASIFSRIIAGDIPGRIVWDDDTCVVMVDIRPLHRGHCLVIPKQEVDHWVDLDSTTVQHLTGVAHIVAGVQQSVFRPERVGLMIAGFEVPHTHMHVIPIDTMADLNFANADTNADPEDLDRVAELLRDGLIAAGHEAEVSATR